jgi:hypothetical protein
VSDDAFEPAATRSLFDGSKSPDGACGVVHGLFPASADDAVPVWNGLQQASLATRAKIQYLAVTGPQTVDNATTFVATLAQTNCDLVFAAGDIPVTSVNQSAPTFPNTRFLIVHGTATHSNVSIVDGQTPQQITAAVNQIVTNAVP